jgi:hypothetical protein
MMPTLKSLMIFAALLAGGTSLAIAQNGFPTGGQSPVAGGANGGGWGGGWYARAPVYGYGYGYGYVPTDICMPTIGLTTATGIGITKQIAAKVTSLPTDPAC